MMAVSEVAGITGSGETSKSAGSRALDLKRRKRSALPSPGPLRLNLNHFYLSNPPIAQSIRAQAAIYSIVNNCGFTLPRSNLNSNFESVNQQSGLQAGDGGFQVSVANNTALVGGVIASTQQAVEANRNRFTTANQLRITDVQNTASFSGTAVGISAGFGGGKPSGSAGVGTTSGNAASTTTAGITAIAGNTAVRTGDAQTGIKPIFNAGKVQAEVNAQVAITQAFTQQLGPIVGKAVISLLERMTTPDQSPTAAKPTPAADKVVRSDQDMRAGFAAIANSTDLKDPEKAFFADVAKAYSGNTHFAGLVGLATTDPVGYQQSVTPQTDSQVNSSVDRGAMSPVVMPFVPGVAGAAPAGATSAANAWAASIRDSGLVYDPQTDTLRSASGGVISGEKFREVIGNGLSGAANGVKEVFRLAFPFAAAIIQTVTGLASTGTTTTTRPKPLLPNNTGNNSPATVASGTPSSSAPAPVGSSNTGGNQTANPMSGTTVGGGFAAGGVPTVNPVVMSVDSRLPIPEPTVGENGIPVMSNGRHTPGVLGYNPTTGTEPRNSLDLFNNSVPDPKDPAIRYSVDSQGHINRFFGDNNGIFHWSGSTGDRVAPLNPDRIAISVRRLFGFR